MNEIVYLARTFACIAHEQRNQRYDDLPYLAHLEDVVAVMKEFGCEDEELLAAGYLHDVVEDCGVSCYLVEQRFGRRVSELVCAVSDEPGRNRAERHKLTYPKIFSTPDATFLKLADRIANVRACLRGKSKILLEMYTKEHGFFSAALRVQGEYEEMWRLLEGLLR
jgi:guanosine-3',5'-bis(diphosphate) 3'-pyrophosphohydrolase